LVITQPDRPVGRGLKTRASAVKQYAVAHALPLHQPHTLKSDDAIARLREAGPQVLVVAAYGMIVPQAVLDLPIFGALNIHASLLPRWRGAAPIQRALLAGDAETGITIMQMDAGLDTGAILEQRPVPIAEDDDAGTLHDKLAALGAEVMVQALDRFEAGALRPRPQPEEGVTYAAKITKADAILDWNKPASELDRVVRAFRPSPGASTILHGEPLKVWSGRPVAASAAPAGFVARADAEGIVVGCGTGALSITELQRPGGRRMRADEFLRGHPLAAGTRFG
jgi:methionyl-tRNA formyltransferase